MAGIDSNWDGADCGASFLQLILITVRNVNIATVGSSWWTGLVFAFLILWLHTNITGYYLHVKFI